jgi:alginate O-acetyltransferase complex protein AlgI
MSFNSLEFLVFFPVVVVLYFAIPYRYRLWLLLAASYFFYMSWNAPYALILVVMTLIDYTAGIMMGRTDDRQKRRRYLALSLTGNLSLLCVFKYFNFFSQTAYGLMAFLGYPIRTPLVNLILPLGISFHTFQTMAYAIDVYRGTIQPERNLLRFAVYVVFFPQLIAGPIERAKHFLVQFREEHDFDYAMAVDGLQLMLWGFFKKVVIADRLAVYVNAIYSSPAEHGPASVLLATYFFAFQIFCDFSGYCDIAIGSAQVMGFRLMQNFDRPYSSTSIPEFWRRWHISLSTWFKDYVYIPLGGNRTARWRWYYNLFVVFAISGLWHGAKWTFVVWGILHGCYMIASAASGDFRRRVVSAIGLDRYPSVHHAIQVFVTFQLVSFAWIFFRANSLEDAGIVIRTLPAAHWAIGQLKGPFTLMEFGWAVALVVFLEVVQAWQGHQRLRDLVTTQPIWIRWGLYYAAICVILTMGKFDETRFIYFQF